MRSLNLYATALFAVTFFVASTASAFSLSFDNLKLRKIDGKILTSAELKSANLAVFVAAGTSCPVVRLYIPALNALATRWKTKNIRFYLIGAAKHDSFASFRAEFREFNLRFTAAFDEGQLLSSRLAFQSTSQVVVYNVATDEILYRGAIDDRVGIDGEKPAPTHDFLNSVLAAVAANKPPPITSSQAFGCAITY